MKTTPLTTPSILGPFLDELLALRIEYRQQNRYVHFEILEDKPVHGVIPIKVSDKNERAVIMLLWNTRLQEFTGAYFCKAKNSKSLLTLRDYMITNFKNLNRGPKLWLYFEESDLQSIDFEISLSKHSDFKMKKVN